MKWSIVRKSQIIGALAGALLTATLLAIAFTLSPPTSQHGDDATALNYQEGLEIFVLWPSVPILKLFGLFGANKWLLFALAMIVNSLALFLIGTLVGWLIQNFRPLISKLLEKN